MNETTGSSGASGWKTLLDGYPWFEGEGKFPLPAYSEFLPPPRVGRRPYGEADPAAFREDDPFGWPVSELEEETELQPGLEHVAKTLVGSLARFGSNDPEPLISGEKGRNLKDNPYWPPELAAAAGRLAHERYVVLLPLALSRTQDDKARVRWTLFGGSEQGPERAFWKGFFEGPGRERPLADSLSFVSSLLREAFGVEARESQALRRCGFRILPSTPDPAFPHWTADALPTWTGPFLSNDTEAFDEARYLLTFRPFGRLPAPVRERYLRGDLHLIPFPGSLVFWGSPTYRNLLAALPLALQVPLLRSVPRRHGPGGLKVPQSGWLNEPRRDRKASDPSAKAAAATYRRTNRMNRVARWENDVDVVGAEDRVTRVLFSTESDAIGLYDKPLARNCQIWTEEYRLLLDGPRAGRKEIEKAASTIAEGGDFEYRFLFPAMRVGVHEVYWHRPLAAFRDPGSREIRLLPDAPLGYFTAYRADAPDATAPVDLWPRVLRRETRFQALRAFDPARDYFALQTPLNVLTLFHVHEALGGRPLPRGFARRMLRLAKDLRLEAWLDSLPGRARDARAAEKVRAELESRLEPPADPGAPSDRDLPEPLTFPDTATRAFEEKYWTQIRDLAHGKFVCKDNADPVQDPATLEKLPHRRRDLEALGDLLLERHRNAIREAGLEGPAAVGDLPFRWRTEHEYPLFGGWRKNQEGKGSERNLLVTIPGKDRREAVVLADHYDTAYMEDAYDRARGGTGARLAAAGADDNYSATATLLLAAPIFLRMAREGKLERDVWLLHLTGEEFPADCLGARAFCRSLVERTLALRLEDGSSVDLSKVRVAGAFVLDMIAHNKDSDEDTFQISPGRSVRSLRLAREAHTANRMWNAAATRWNQKAERKGKGRGHRSADPAKIPDIALHPHLHGEVRTSLDPGSSLFNTDGQIFSDAGVPVVLFMENYDLRRTGYHDARDTMENIDLDFGSAVAAIAIETVARCATAPRGGKGA